MNTRGNNVCNRIALGLFLVSSERLNTDVCNRNLTTITRDVTHRATTTSLAVVTHPIELIEYAYSQV